MLPYNNVWHTHAKRILDFNRNNYTTSKYEADLNQAIRACTGKKDKKELEAVEEKFKRLSLVLIILVFYINDDAKYNVGIVIAS